jgi:hypothetical protein
MTTKLRLGHVPKTEHINITIALAVELKDLLDRYAALHSQSNGDKNDTTRLIPYVLEAFMPRDRAFQSVWGRVRVSTL